ncbi:hypothetical protein [uncultured Oscillibacter sp.]|jgi:hypothetical protein|uniref:hypothetical protein n=1 Tax=uncultured Oscillibacter sp. TaxID=876091 RepID=UPI00266F7568|nr:hypothetical protein [uncultured Oscillibacter sp.]
MNELINFSLPAGKLSCFVGNLFAELETPCEKQQYPDGLILCGRTAAGRDAMLLIGRDSCTFIGSKEDYNAARNGRCPSRRCSFGG